MIQAYFENIKEIISAELHQAKREVLIAMAWLTDAELFSILAQKAHEGIKVEIIILDDEINNNSSIGYDDIDGIAGSKVYRVSTTKLGPLMHNKFCIIDSATIITGSYNWSYKARLNHENITIAKDSSLGIQFENEFRRIKALYFPEIEPDTIKNNVGSDVILHQDKINLRTQCYIIEMQVCGIENEIIIINKRISDFNFLYDSRVGKLVAEILLARKMHAKTRNEMEDAEEKIREFEKTRDEKLKSGWVELSDNEMRELKSIFRKASKMCHPDLVSKESINYAAEVFNTVKELYERNDLSGLRNVYEKLEGGLFPTQNLTEKDQLELTVNRLKLKLEVLIAELHALKKTDIYITISGIQDVDEYFKYLEDRLQKELKDTIKA